MLFKLHELGTDYQRSMKTAQADYFMACFQSKLMKVIFKTLHFGSMYNLSKCRNVNYLPVLLQQRGLSTLLSSTVPGSQNLSGAKPVPRVQTLP